MAKLGGNGTGRAEATLVSVSFKNDSAASAKMFNLKEYSKLNDFLEHLKQKCGESSHPGKGVILKDGQLITTDAAYANLKSGDKVVYKADSGTVSSFRKDDISYVPHYDTLIKSGLYEYYASEGTNPIPYAFAELIDNALEATARNKGFRKIELRLNIDESGDHSSVIVLDNGHGMTSKQLNNWAIYRLSKFNRKDVDTPVQPIAGNLKRSLNSDISYFGVGGKQAAFFIGNSVRMITKSIYSDSVHELSISTDEFQKKEKLSESVYKGSMITRSQRKEGNMVPSEDHLVDSLIQSDECGKESFTFVVIQGIGHSHAAYLKHNFQTWCRQLAHIYHYYIHGPDGNVGGEATSKAAPVINLDIEVNLNARGSSPKIVHLCDIDDDLQSLYIQSAASTFDFKATVEGGGVVEGILRYHPFLYDSETFPKDVSANANLQDGEEDEVSSSDTKFLTKNPMFECFWNGRLIPHTRIQDFEWCSLSKKSKNIPVECFNRISGVLWTDNVFEVSTNKLTFMDLTEKLRSKNTVFCRVINSQEKRGNIDKQFNEWLNECHEGLDKQILFSDFQGLETRSDMPKTRQYPWSIFKSVEWDGKVFQRGQLVKFLRVLPIQHGTIKRFLLYGDHGGDVYATGGFIEVVLEPKSLYGEVKIHPLTKLDRDATQINILKWIEEEEVKLPDRLVISWPEGGEVCAGDRIPAGTTIGAIKVEITNRKGEAISKIPGSNQKKLLVELKVIWHSSTGDTTVVHHICQHAKTWPYWFKKMENFTNLGSYTLKLQAVLNENESSFHAGKELPSHRIRFSTVEAEAATFTVAHLEGPFYVGVPFQVPLQFQDKFGNATKPPELATPSVEAAGVSLKCSGTEVKGQTLVIKNVSANGLVDSGNGKNFQLKFKIDELPGALQSVKMKFFPGPPCRLLVSPGAVICNLENGKSIEFQVQVQDVAGNPTSAQHLTVSCRFVSKHSNMPTYSAACNGSGQAVLTGPPLKLAKISGSETVKAIIEVQNHKNVPCVEKTVNVVPSSGAVRMEVSYEGSTGEQIEIVADKELQYRAGEVITGVRYKLYDEASRHITLTPLLASSVVVNWGAPRKKSDFFLDGKLPDITVSQTSKEATYCYIQLEGSDLKFSFIIKPLPGDPASLKCTCLGSTTVRLGEVLADIVAEPVDIYGNSIKKLSKASLPFLSVSADGLSTDKLVRAVGQADVFLIQGVTFVGGALGARKVSVFFKDVMGHVQVEVVAGLPASISLADYNSEDVYTVVNGKPLPYRLQCELRDEHGNRSNEAGFKMQFICDPHVKLTPSPQILQTDKSGSVDFGTLVVNVRSNNLASSCPENLCGQNCFGVYTFLIKSTHPTGRKVIKSPDIRLHVKPDCSKPSKLEVNYSQTAPLVAGLNLPDFTVYVVAEDGSILTNVTSDQIVMNMWQEDGKNQNIITLSPVFSRLNAVGQFLFSNFETPYSGSYKIQFMLKSTEHRISSSVISVNIKPNIPVSLVSSEPLDSFTVTNTPCPDGRTIVRRLILELKDSFLNSTDTCSGKLTVKVTTKDNSQLPTLLGGVKSFEVPIRNGVACLENVCVEDKSVGVDGKEYYLNCTATVNGLPKKDAILPPFIIPFTFYNDAAKQEKMMNLLKQRRSLIASIAEKKEILEETEALMELLQSKVNLKKEEEEAIRAELNNYNVPLASLTSFDSITSLIGKKRDERETLLKVPRRKCDVPEVPKEENVLGKVCHLAQIDDNDISRVVSWHMGRYMECVVTRTTEKAMEIYERTNNLQQVLALDSLFRKNLPSWSKPLPHTKIRGGFQVRGNPVYARDLLIFTEHAEDCKLVFSQLLGDTIILDSVAEASTYRREVVKYTSCPTLLTRTGDRILSSGILGGRDNKAPPVNMTKGPQFAQPVSLEHSNLCTVIEVLEALKRAKRSHQDAREKLQSLHQKVLEKTGRTKKDIVEEETSLRELEMRIEKHNSPRPPVAPPVHRTPKVGVQLASTPPTSRSTRGSRDTPSSAAAPSRVSARRQAPEERVILEQPVLPMSTRKRSGVDVNQKELKRTRK